MDLDVLRRAPLFATLDDEVFTALTKELTEVELSRGSSIFHEGDQGDQLYFIISGKIKLGRSTPDGRENLLAVLGPGEIFGEMALFNPAPRTATATAVRPGQPTRLVFPAPALPLRDGVKPTILRDFTEELSGLGYRFVVVVLSVCYITHVLDEGAGSSRLLAISLEIQAAHKPPW